MRNIRLFKLPSVSYFCNSSTNRLSQCLLQYGIYLCVSFITRDFIAISLLLFLVYIICLAESQKTERNTYIIEDNKNVHSIYAYFKKSLSLELVESVLVLEFILVAEKGT